ncbi:YELLOW STRIPE like 7 [Actinidia rufa]|uniref:YELLOW STRIPE like 7 n=1 Tax=Actinidia rufa TaxID=165716 RepID=A0A7J0FNV3_9ERIC|nr:YELLOW STRIPE like 7 [Actinidia rufa]
MQVFIAIAMFIGDGLYNFLKVISKTIAGLSRQLRSKRDAGTILPLADRASPDTYVEIAAILVTSLPHIFPQLKWYYILVIYVFAPTLAFCNAYGCGLTDWSLASTYGKLAIFTIGAWTGKSHFGVLAGLAACGVMTNIVSTASDLMQDFKTV